MWRIIINIKGFTLTFNHGFTTKMVDDQLSLNRQLTFRH